MRMLRQRIVDALQSTGESARLRIAREGIEIAEARAELEAGLYVGSSEVNKWIDSVGSGHDGSQPFHEDCPDLSCRGRRRPTMSENGVLPFRILATRTDRAACYVR